ncbi:MAG: LexA family transcriptional regulator [Planctomycetota bacterium]|nr:LexA family transcriptional regulator [Planctomycetota bacterium]
MRKIFRDDTHTQDLCQRITQVRTETCGVRGKSAFAKALGLSPSTYEYYESTRVPPADVLLRIAAVGGVDLTWLLTGQAAAVPVAADHPILQRAARLLADSPQAAAPLTAFLDLLGKAMGFPQKENPSERGEEEGGIAKPQAAGGEGSPAATATPAAATPATAAAPAAGDRAGWVPVLGRSAAGVAQFWSQADNAGGLTQLAELIARQGKGERTQPMSVSSADGAAPGPVWLVTLDSPDANDVAEFLAGPDLKARYADAFALRIDGDSMSPDIRHGDLVVLSPSAPAQDGRAAVVQLAGQIGVTCKLFRRVGGSVHLIPINDAFPTQTFPAGSVEWAFRVLARVRL